MAKGSESYRAINYTLRPAKSIERKMLCEAIRLLSAFDRIENYLYVGFGSIYFADFSFFHKALGLTKMLSIELPKTSDVEKRVSFNKPYSCIDIDFRHSNEVLPQLKWNSHTIAWLDYDYPLNSSVLVDINSVCSKIISGGMLIISVNANLIDNPNDSSAAAQAKYRFDWLINQVGRNKIPINTTGQHLNNKGIIKVYRNIIVDEINECLSYRNGGLSNGEKIHFQQLFNFKYKDGATMATVGGVFYSEKDKDLFQSIKFDNLDFIRKEEDFYDIQVPQLTYKEIGSLDASLHQMIDFTDYTMKDHKLESNGVPVEDIQKYAKVYRYYPTFAEAII